ncbi:hypothetical protein WAI453_003645 [Rhynchosporium graminicola]
MGFNYQILILPIRVLQAVFAIIVLGTLAYAASTFYNSPSSVSFLIFTSIFTLLALVYLILASSKFPKFTHKYAFLGVEAVTMIFWFAGFIALADLLGDAGCGRWHGRGSGTCRASTAGTVFAAFEWVLFTITTAVAALGLWRTKGESTLKQNPETAVHV